MPQHLPVWWEPGVFSSLEQLVSHGACLLPTASPPEAPSGSDPGREQGGHSELQNAKVKPPVALKKLSPILIDHGHLAIIVVANPRLLPSFMFRNTWLTLYYPGRTFRTFFSPFFKFKSECEAFYLGFFVCVGGVWVPSVFFSCN